MKQLYRAAGLFALLLALLWGSTTWAAPALPLPTTDSARPAQTEPVVTMSVVVTVPASTPLTDTIYIAGNFQEWDPDATPLEREGNVARGEVTIAGDGNVEYKFTRGSWDRVEKGEGCVELPNRSTEAEQDGTLEGTVATWADLCSEPFYDTRLHTVTLDNTELTVAKKFFVYTPPSYDENNPVGYPVLYLFRGHEKEWVNPNEDGSRGGSNVIDVYEELLAAGQVGPMILVFPGISSADNSVSGLLTDFLRPDMVPEDDQASVGEGAFERYFLNDIIGYMDANYATIPARDARGVDGFSLGGFMAIKIAAKYPELFASAGSYDGTFLYADPTCLTISPNDTLYYSPLNDWLYAPAFGPLPRDGFYAAENNAANLICNGDATELARVQWLIQYAPDEAQGNFLRGEHVMMQLSNKGIDNDISPTHLPGGHNWAMADEHMRQTLPLHYARLAPPPTALTGGPLSAETEQVAWLLLVGMGLAGGGVLLFRRRSARAEHAG